LFKHDDVFKVFGASEIREIPSIHQETAGLPDLPLGHCLGEFGWVEVAMGW